MVSLRRPGKPGRWAHLDLSGNVLGQSIASCRDRHACVLNAAGNGYAAIALRRPAAMLSEPFTRLKLRETGVRSVC